MSWHDQAACRGANTHLFFPHGHANARALDYCAHCPVIADCLEEALLLPVEDDHGIRGGATTAERRLIRTARRSYQDRHTEQGAHA